MFFKKIENELMVALQIVALLKSFSKIIQEQHLKSILKYRTETVSDLINLFLTNDGFCFFQKIL